MTFSLTEPQSTTLEQISAVDAVVLVTAHPSVDLTAIVTRSELFVDLRGVTRTPAWRQHRPAVTSPAAEWSA
jgi:UDP-N-acetyl-D-mannosaminuronate dehydrogenase